MIPERYKNYMYNENDFFNEGFYVQDPEKDELVRKLACMITDDIALRTPKSIAPDYPDYWILDRLLTKEQVKFMLSFKKKRVAKLTAAQTWGTDSYTKYTLDIKPAEIIFDVTSVCGFDVNGGDHPVTVE